MKPTYLIALVLAAGLVAACEKEAPKTPPAPKVTAPAPAPAPAAEAPKPAEAPAAPATEPKKDEVKK